MEATATVHGLHRIPEFKVWERMRSRCNNPNNTSYSDYGGRGIQVCERWNRFENFYADVGQRPSPKHSIDRFPDNDGNYEPGNVRWATGIEQASNTRATVLWELNGESLTAAEWARRHGMNRRTLYKRLREGFSIQDALSTPVRRYEK
jgi:hypothetical protein